MALLNEKEHKQEKMYVYIWPDLFSYTVIGQSLCYGVHGCRDNSGLSVQHLLETPSKTAVPCPSEWIQKQQKNWNQEKDNYRGCMMNRVS